MVPAAPHGSVRGPSRSDSLAWFVELLLELCGEVFSVHIVASRGVMKSSARSSSI